jgi:hypothetical protein
MVLIMDLEDEYPYMVIIPFPVINRQPVVFWLWETIGDCPICPQSLRIAFGNEKRVKKTGENMWCYVKWNTGQFRFKQSQHATLFKIRWS